MKNKENLPEDQTIISMKELRDIGYSQYMVSKLVDGGKLIHAIKEKNRIFIMWRHMRRKA